MSGCACQRDRVQLGFFAVLQGSLGVGEYDREEQKESEARVCGRKVDWKEALQYASCCRDTQIRDQDSGW